MLERLGLMPPEASTVAFQVDLLYGFLLAVSAFFSILIAVAVIGLSIKYRRRSPDQRTPHIHGSTALEVTWSVIPFGITMIMFFWGAQPLRHDEASARRRAPGERRRQAVDVEAPAPRGPARDQRAARPGRTAREADAHLRGRDPQLLRAGVPHQAGRRARPLHDDVVRGDQDRALPPLLRRVLRHGALRDDRPIVVMDPADYQSWLAGESGGAGTAMAATTGAVSIASAGEGLFGQLGCATCHKQRRRRARTVARRRLRQDRRARRAARPSRPTTTTSASRSSLRRRRSSPASSR